MQQKQYKPFKKAFTLLEMIIVMVVLGIIANFGVEMLVNTYQNYIFTSVQNRLQSQSESAVKQIANRLEYRIKESIIAKDSGSGKYHKLVSAPATFDADMLEWVGSDREGWLGRTNVPLWSGFIDINNPAGAKNIAGGNLISPQTDTGAVNTLISTLSNANSNINDAALFSIEANTGTTNFGWDGAITSQRGSLHPIEQVAGQNDEFAAKAGTGNFVNGGFITEFYKLTWTAYAVRFEDKDGDGANELWLYYDYQPWAGEDYTNGKSEQLMDNVTTFAFKVDGSVVNLQVCVNDRDIFNDDGDNDETTGSYSVCKEKTVF